MIRALILDDEPLALRLLEVYAGRVEDMKIVAACTGTEAARPFLDSVDVIFADINMPLSSGMEFIASLPHPPVVVFTTAYADYAVEAFKVGAVDYLLKPFTFEEFSRAVGRVREALSFRDVRAREESVVFFKSGHQIVPVRVSDIRYVEGFGPYVKIFRVSELSPLIVLSSFQQILQRLPQDRFVRIHKSYIVDITRVSAVERSSVTLAGGFPLPVGDSYRAGFLERYIRNARDNS